MHYEIGDIFNRIPYTRNKEYEKRVEEIKTEKALNGDDIRNILIKKISGDGFLTTTERNVRGINEHPFDLVVGYETKLALAGFEIKGDTDNFSRLKSQLQGYQFAFNEIYLVLHKKKAPEWLPQWVGILRVFENGDIVKENYAYIYGPFDISTDYEWDALFRANDLGITSKKTREILQIVRDVRRNVLFNRFFAVHSGYGTKKFEKFYPMTEKQKSVLIGFDIPYHYKEIVKDLNKLDKRVVMLKNLCSLGQKGLQEFEKDSQKKLGIEK